MIDHQKTFSKQEHLCSERHITQLFEKGESFISYPMRIVWSAFPALDDYPVKVVMTVPKKKIRSAVNRNRIKRLLRESFRLNKASLIQIATLQGISLHLAFIWIPSEQLEYERVDKKMKDSLLKLEKQISTLKVVDEKISE